MKQVEFNKPDDNTTIEEEEENEETWRTTASCLKSGFDTS
jgi:hypothetical protein